MKLNLGCGSNKIEDCINIDVEESCKPDVVCNFLQENLPYNTESIDEVYFFHCIEHIQKRAHHRLLLEINRVLKSGHYLIISYPEFLKCVENWKVNKFGKRSFWEATLYGRQLYPSDYHVCIMDTEEFKMTLLECGFKVETVVAEPGQEFNTVLSCAKQEPYRNYESLLAEDMAATRIITSD